MQEQSMSEMLKVKVRLPTDRLDQGNYIIESMDSFDEGRYICRATNSLGTAEAFVDVNMLGMSSAAVYKYFIVVFSAICFYCTHLLPCA